MRKYLASLVFVGCAWAAPLSAEPAHEASGVEAGTAVAVQQVRVTAVTGRRDQAAMVLVGTALIGLAAAVRRAA